MSAEWHNLLASFSGQRQGPGSDTLAALPETPRIRASALSARLRKWNGVPRDTTVADLDLQNAAFTTEQWRAWIDGGKAPSSWPLWLDQMHWVGRFLNGGQAGVADEEFYASALRYAERFQAPQAVRDIVAFRHAMAAWNFPAASGAADRILPVVLGGARWLPADELRDATVVAKLHTGDAAGARKALDALRGFSLRSPDDLRSRMLDAYVMALEESKATAVK